MYVCMYVRTLHTGILYTLRQMPRLCARCPRFKGGHDVVVHGRSRRTDIDAGYRYEAKPLRVRRV